MKLETVKTEIVSTMTDDGAIGMTIDNESIKHIIGSLTNIYPNKRLAALREYSTNALDSHIEAGQTRPIEITLPSSFNQNLVFQDWGMGMGRFELEHIYGVYGKSTKRKSNKLNGAYGLGSKSALTLVQSFNLVSVKDGKKFTVIINKDKDDVGQLKIISEVETDEPNGVKVTIPAGMANEFAHIASTFFLTWKPGTVLVNGARPMHIDSDNFEAVGDIGYISTRKAGYGRNGGIIVSMGGICYKVGSLSYDQQEAVYGPNTSYHLRSQEMILTAPIGDVELVPSREDVAMSDKTMDFVSKQTRALIKTFLENIKTKIDTAPTRMEAVKLVEQFPFAYSRKEYTWQGEEIPADVPTTWAHWKYNSYNNRKHKYSDDDAKLTITRDTESSVLIDTTGATIETSTIMRHLKSWAKSEGINLGNVYFGRLPEKVNPWMQAMIDEKLLVVEKADNMAEIAKAYNKANRKAREVSTEPRDTLRYPLYALDSKGEITCEGMTVAEIKEADYKLFYLDQDATKQGVEGGLDFNYANRGEATIKEIVKDYLPKNSALVLISTNRKVESFTKRLGDMKIRNAVKAIEDGIVKKVSTEVALADEIAERLAANHSRARVFRAFAGKELKSELFANVVENLVSNKTDTGIVSAYDAARRLLGWNDTTINAIRYAGKEAPTEASMVNAFIAHYPLFQIVLAGLGYNSSVNTEVIDSLVDYLNNAHETKGEFTI